MSARYELNDIIGKTIKAIVILDRQGINSVSGWEEYHLLFTDGTSVEFYGNLHNSPLRCSDVEETYIKVREADPFTKVKERYDANTQRVWQEKGDHLG